MKRIKIEDINEDAFVENAENKKLILKALTDKNFREQLKSNPDKVLDVKGGAINLNEINLILNSVNAIENRIHSVATSLLCSTFLKPDYFKIVR